MEVERLREEKRELTRRATEAEGRLKEVEVECIAQLDGLADENARLCEENKSLLARVSTLQSMNLQLAGQVAELEGRCGVVDGAAVAAELKVQARGLSPGAGGTAAAAAAASRAHHQHLVQARRATVVADGGEAAGAGDAAAAAEAAAGPNGHANGNTSGARRAADRPGRGAGTSAAAARRGGARRSQVGAVGIGARQAAARRARAASARLSSGTSTEKGSDGPAEKRTLPRRSSWHSGGRRRRASASDSDGLARRRDK